MVFLLPRYSALLESARALSSLVVIAGIALTLHSGPWIQSPDGAWNTIALYTLVSALVVLAIQLTVSVNSLLRYAAR